MITTRICAPSLTTTNSKWIYRSSHRRRVDHRKLIHNTVLAIETDEFAHRDYDEKDEEIRYHDLYMIHSSKWIFSRFNPDNIGGQDIDLEDRSSVLSAKKIPNC